MNIGENIRHYRKKLDLTQAQLADRLGVSVQAVSKWETGAGMPDTAQIVPLAQALKIKTDTLLCNRDREREYKRRWEHALRYEHGNPAKLLAVCQEILEEDPTNTAFLYRAAVSEKWLAADATDDTKKYFHWSRSHHYISRLLRLDPDDESGNQHLVEVLSALGQDDEAVAQAYRCADTSLALLKCLKGEALRQHRQKQIDRKFLALLNEIEQAGMPEITESLIRAAIPDGNYHHYASFLFIHGWNRAREQYSEGNHDAVMVELQQQFDLARAMDESKLRPRFTAPLFDLLDGSHNPPGTPSHTEQFIEESLFLFRDLQYREDYKQLIADAMAYLIYMEKGTA